ncbi:hypothetical protein BX666DRAFT_2004778 [Dichotomocladium elegans]|nr:hypothetical protein BX666DRAFT_2004778 [Dichotomocladium elegans]
MSETVIQLRDTELQSDNGSEFERRTGFVMARMIYLRGLVCNMVRRSSDDTTTDGADEDLISGVDQFERGYAAFVAEDWAAYEAYAQGIPAAKRSPHMDRRLQEVDGAYAALKSLLLRREFKAIRARAQFARQTLPLHNTLAFIDAKILTARTDNDISDLEEQLRAAGKLVWCVVDEHAHDDLFMLANNDDNTGVNENNNNNNNDESEIRQRCEQLRQHYLRTETGLRQARIWLDKATIARRWIQERIDHIESQPLLQDGLLPLDLAAARTTFPTASETSAAHLELKRDVALFCEQHAASLRSHVQTLLENNSNACPADRAIMEMIPETLKLLDRLLLLLEQRTYKIQIIMLRLTWDQACDETNRAIAMIHELLSTFIEDACWELGEEKRIGRNDAVVRNESFVKRFLAIGQQMAELDHGRYTATVNAYRDLNDLCNAELPPHVQVRQQALQKAFQMLTAVGDYAQCVLGQRRVVTDFVYGANDLLAKGTALRMDIRKAELGLSTAVNEASDRLFFYERVDLFQNQTAQLVAHVSGRIRYPKHPQQQNDDRTNTIVRQTIEASESKLAQLGETLNACLAAYQRTYTLQNTAAQLRRELEQLEQSVERQLNGIPLTKVDAFMEHIAFEKSDLLCLQTECENRMAKIASIRNGDEKRLVSAIEALQCEMVAAACIASEEDCVELIPAEVMALRETMSRIQIMLGRLEARVALQRREINALRKRLDWESQYHQISAAVSSAIRDIWMWIDTIQWRPDAAADVGLQPNAMQQELRALLQMSDKLRRLGRECDDTFAEMVKELVGGEDPAILLPARFHQRQNKLQTEFDNLHDSLGFAGMVLEQRMAVAAYMEKALSSQAAGEDLLAKIDDALRGVMDMRTGVSFTVAIEAYGSEIADVWAKYSQPIGYPSRSAGVSAARLSTHDDDINIKIRIAVASQQDKLCYLRDQMQLHNALYTASLRFRVQLVQYLMEANEQTKRIIKITNAIADDRQNLEVDMMDVAACADPGVLVERNKRYTEEVVQTQEAHARLYSRYVAQTDAMSCSSCAPYIRTTMTDEAMDILKEHMENAINISSLHTRELDVYSMRVDWERHIQSATAAATLLLDKVQHTFREQKQKQKADVSERVSRHQLTVWRGEQERAKQMRDELDAQTSGTVDPSFEIMRVGYCTLSGALPAAVARRHERLHDLLAELSDIVTEQQDILRELSEQVRAAEFAEALGRALRQTLDIKATIEDTGTEDLSDNCITMWHRQIGLVSLEIIKKNACTDDERAGYEQLLSNHKELVELLESAKAILRTRRLAESYESRASLLVVSFRDMNARLRTARAELDTITGVPADDQSVCDSCAKLHAEIDHAFQQQMVEYNDTCMIFDTLAKEEAVCIGEYRPQHKELEEANTLTRCLLADVHVAIVWASQWRDLHAELEVLASKVDVTDDMLAGDHGESALLEILAEYAKMGAAARKLSSDSGQQGNWNAFQRCYDQRVAAARRRIALKRVKQKAEEETYRIHQRIDTTVSHFGSHKKDDLLVQLQTNYETHATRNSLSRVEVHQVLAEQLQTLSDQPEEDMGCNQSQFICHSQKALESLYSAVEDEANLVALLRDSIPHLKDMHDLLLRIHGCKVDIEDTALTVWDSEHNLVELEGKVLRVEDAMVKLRDMLEEVYDDGTGNGDVTHATAFFRKHVVGPTKRDIDEAWESLWKAFENLKEKASRRKALLNRMQDVLKICSETHERISKLESGSMHAVGMSPNRSLPEMLREKEILLLEQELEAIETAFGDHVTAEVQKLDDQFGELEDDREMIEQRIDLDDAIANLLGLMEGNRERLSGSLDVGRCLDMADDIELLLEAFREAMVKPDPAGHHQEDPGTGVVATTGVELDARLRHYKQKIVQKLKTAELAAEGIADNTHRQLVIGHLAELERRWQLQSRSAPMGDLDDRTRKPSLPTRRSPPSRLPIVVAVPSVQCNTSSPLVSMGRLLPSSSSSSQRMSRLRQRRMIAPSLKRVPSKSASNAHTPMSTEPPSPQPQPQPQPVNNYEADPKNDLDMEIGRIVNTIGYKVTVKRVPGETGRYWFGEVTPKIAFCRVLKSKMVMVRVGGGWMELTEFMRNHALFDGDFSVPKPSVNTDKPDLRFQECFIETRKHRIRERSLPGSL